MSARRLGVCALALLAACRAPTAPPPAPPPEPAPVERSELPELVDDGSTESLREAIGRSFEALGRRPEAPVALGESRCTGAEIRVALAGLRGLDPPAIAAEAAERFDVYRMPAGRVTGYYEPVVRGALAREGAFVHPLYRRPPDLIDVDLGRFSPEWAGRRTAGRVSGNRLEPYLSRREIDGEGRLAGRGLELVWLDDLVARFFLQVQGSGVVRLPDGRSVRVGFAGSNGRPYTSIGRVLLAEGALARERSTAGDIQAWLRAHPERRDEILERNERYVFFREAADGPVGSLGATLTPGRSIAVDPARVPLGLVAWLEAEVPVLDESGEPAGTRTMRRFVAAQDTGAAITGPGRVDVFFGTGERAGRIAGATSGPGTLYVLVPRCAGH